MEKLYLYKKRLPHTPHGRGLEASLVVDGKQAFVASFFSMDDMAHLFGGFIVCCDEREFGVSKTYIGVWGKDKVRKFIRLLRARGADFEIEKIDGSERQVTQTSQHFSR